MSLNTTCVLHSCCETQEGYSIYVVRHRRGIPYILMKLIKISGNRTYFSTYPVESPAFGLKTFLSLQAFFQDIEKKKVFFFFFFRLQIFAFKCFILSIPSTLYKLSFSCNIYAWCYSEKANERFPSDFHKMFAK